MFQIADEQNVNFRIYNTEGMLITNTKILPSEGDESITESTLTSLRQNPTTNYVEITEDGKSQNRSSYSFIINETGVAIGVLNLSYVDDDSLSAMELQNFLSRLMQVYLFILGVAIILAYVVSRFITKSLEEISDKITQTALDTANQKIDLNPPGKELSKLINAYNDMVDQLSESAVRLAKSEREQAWREMAKQVAHEIKNPLTPMRLSVQSFEQQFDPINPSASKKIEEFSSTLIHQIDTLSTIASAFSNFAEMPVQESELLDVVKITRLGMDIFTEKYIVFEAPNEPLFARLDRTQLIRILTNLVKNAIQACDEVPEPSIVVRVQKKNDKVCICVTDNGHGITQENISKIFEPKFTTKTSGMGLGLAMVKNIVETYDGQIEVESSTSKGTSFFVWLPFVNSTA